MSLPAWATVALAMSIFAPVAEAKCPRNIVGVWSGLMQSDSFQSTGGQTDKSTILGRLNFSSGNTYQADFVSRNSDESVGKAAAATGTYTFSATTCTGTLDLSGSQYRLLVTDNGRVMFGMLFESTEDNEHDVASLTLYKE